jgi:hypothetical protein
LASEGYSDKLDNLYDDKWDGSKDMKGASMGFLSSGSVFEKFMKKHYSHSELAKEEPI